MPSYRLHRLLKLHPWILVMHADWLGSWTDGPNEYTEHCKWNWKVSTDHRAWYLSFFFSHFPLTTSVLYQAPTWTTVGHLPTLFTQCVSLVTVLTPTQTFVVWILIFKYCMWVISLRPKTGDTLGPTEVHGDVVIARGATTIARRHHARGATAIARRHHARGATAIARHHRACTLELRLGVHSLSKLRLILSCQPLTLVYVEWGFWIGLCT